MRYAFLSLLFSFVLNCCGQSNQQPKSKETQRKVGGPCEGCEAIYDSPVPFKNLSWTDTLPDFNEPGPKLVISGIVYKADGKTLAKDVVIYVYHTDQTGHYTNRNKEKGYAGRNGYIKGWMKTNDRGEYKFYTLRPAPYPNAAIPAHIHPIIKEADKNDYYIDEYRFDDDPLLTAAERKKEEGRGGSGIIHLVEKDGLLQGQRNLYLGKNIPDYPPEKR
jgi:protocatechuate 3,4-dioxygenase beta subunit